jgi:hypothetical protein
MVFVEQGEAPDGPAGFEDRRFPMGRWAGEDSFDDLAHLVRRFMAARQVAGRSWGACPSRRTVTGMTARLVPTRPIPERVVVVGCAGSGKTTLAREVAARLDARHIERDALGDDEAPGFAALVAAAVEAAGRRWVFDGALYNAEALVYPHGDALVALDYPRRVRREPADPWPQCPAVSMRPGIASYFGAIMVRRAGCLTLAVAGPAGKLGTVTVPIMVAQC